MRGHFALLVAAATASSGCIVQHPGSQTLMINPFSRDGWVQEADAESNRFWRDATGDRRWGEGQQHWALAR
jgi:hypothetical protein